MLLALHALCRSPLVRRTDAKPVFQSLTWQLSLCAVLTAHARDELGIDPDDLAKPLQVRTLVNSPS